MKVFYNNKFRGHYPVGSAAIVVALNVSEAAALLQVELEKCGLDQIVYVNDMIEINYTQSPQVIILSDGNY